MTVQEFKSQFDLLYDNIATKGAPGLDEYEISVLLTLAQEELVKNYNNPESNKLNEGFENSSKRRTDLKELIRDYKTTSQILSDKGISENSTFFVIPDDVFVIKSESVIITDPICGKINATVVPKTHDEYETQKDNPFKKPSKDKVWRLDYNSTEPGQNVVELISELPIEKYNMRYLKRANPIILTDLNAGDFLDSGLTILEQTQQQTSELDPSIHSEIVRRAVELATLSYKENNLNNILQLYQRKE